MAETNQIQTLEKITETNNQRDPSKLTSEELFHAMYRAYYLYTRIIDRFGGVINTLNDGEISADEAERNSFRWILIQRELDKTIPPIYDEIAKRMGLTFEEKESAVKQVYSRNSGL